MTASRGIARAGLIVTVAFFIARILGSVRLIVIGAEFGASADLDAFLAAFRIPDFIFQLVAAGALSSALIPVISGLLATDEEARAWRVASTVVSLMLVILLILAVIVAILAPVLVPVIAGDFTPAQMAQTVELTRVMLLSPILLACGALATSLLNAKGRFTAAALAPIVYNLGIIFAAVFLAPVMGIVGLAVGVVIGAAGHFLVQLPPLRRTGFRYTPRIDLGDADAREALLLMVPRAIGLAASQLTFLVAVSISTGLGVGAVTAFTFAFSIFQLPIGVIGIPARGGHPALDVARARPGRGRALSWPSCAGRIRLILFVMIPLTGLAIITRGGVVQLLFDYGKMDDQALQQTAQTLGLLLFGMTSESVIAILARSFYAGRDTATPVIAAILAVAINVTLAIALAGPLGLPGIGLAITLGSLGRGVPPAPDPVVSAADPAPVRPGPIRGPGDRHRPDRDRRGVPRRPGDHERGRIGAGQDRPVLPARRDGPDGGHRLRGLRNRPAHARDEHDLGPRNRARAAPYDLAMRFAEATPDELVDWDRHTVDRTGRQRLPVPGLGRARSKLGWRPRYLVADDGYRLLSLERPWRFVGGAGAYLSKGPISAGEPVARTAERLEAAAELAVRTGGRRDRLGRRDPGRHRLSGPDRGDMASGRSRRSSPRATGSPLPSSRASRRRTYFAGFAMSTRQRVRQAEKAGLRVDPLGLSLARDAPADCRPGPGRQH